MKCYSPTAGIHDLIYLLQTMVSWGPPCSEGKAESQKSSLNVLLMGLGKAVLSEESGITTPSCLHCIMPSLLSF